MPSILREILNTLFKPGLRMSMPTTTTLLPK